MFANIGDKLKNFAYLLLFFSVVIGTIWFFISFKNWADSKDFIRVSDDLYAEYMASKSGITSSITLIVSGIISSFISYGFGEIICLLTDINEKINKTEIVKEEKTVSSTIKTNKEEIVHEMTRAELYDNLNK